MMKVDVATILASRLYDPCIIGVGLSDLRAGEARSAGDAVGSLGGWIEDRSWSPVTGLKVAHPKLRAQVYPDSATQRASAAATLQQAKRGTTHAMLYEWQNAG